MSDLDQLIRQVRRRPWPAGVGRIDVPMGDGTRQPSIWWSPPDDTAVPLLVGLHSWSNGHASAGADAIYAEWCMEHGWAFLHPDFRGPNGSPEGTGSDRAVADIVASVAWARGQREIDEDRIYLVGVSGGGHMALLTLSRHPGIWAAVSAWCPVTDLVEWHRERSADDAGDSDDSYAADIERAVGGDPQHDPRAAAEAQRRSPVTALRNASGVPLDLGHGIRDDVVPHTHSLRAYAAATGVPEPAPGPRPEGQGLTDDVYGSWRPLYRQTHKSTRVTLFDGGHMIVHRAALNWLSAQRKGQPVVWDMTRFDDLEITAGLSGR